MTASWLIHSEVDVETVQSAMRHFEIEDRGRYSMREGAKVCHYEGFDNAGLRHEKTLVSQGLTEKNQGLGAMRALGLEPRTQGLKVPCSTN